MPPGAFALYHAIHAIPFHVSVASFSPLPSVVVLPLEDFSLELARVGKIHVLMYLLFRY